MKLLEKENLNDLVFGYTFLDTTPKAPFIKANNVLH